VGGATAGGSAKMVWPMRTAEAPSPTQNILHASRISRFIVVERIECEARASAFRPHESPTNQACRAFPQPSG
jgi:hypothetical protein